LSGRRESLVGDPLGECGELPAAGQVAVTRKHRIVRRGQVERGDVDRSVQVKGKDGVPRYQQGRNRMHLAFVDVALDEGKDGSTRWVRLFRRLVTGDKGRDEAAVIMYYWEWIG
jgi:hypothetical protein